MTKDNQNINQPFVSIIVPCYNVEHLVDKGLESIFNQTYNRWECIVVNDGSLDNTEELIKNWTKKDNRFALVSQENKGLSGARNTGLKNVNGDCIYFFDPDDLLDKDCLKNLVSLYKKGTDIVIGKSGEVYNQTTDVIKTLKHYTPTETLLSNQNFIELALKQPFSVVAWNKLYNADFIFSNHLTFKDGIVHEDELWFFQTMYFAKNIIFNSKITYYYNVGNQDSITKNYSLKNLKSYLTVTEEIYSTFYLQEKNEHSKIIIGTYILEFQLTIISAFFRFIKKNKNCNFKSEGIELIKKHLDFVNVEEFYDLNPKKTKQFKLFINYRKPNPEIAFKLIRNTNKKSILKFFENIYLKRKQKS